VRVQFVGKLTLRHERAKSLFLDNGRVFVEVPRLMTDEELATVFEAFAAEVRGRSPKTPTDAAPRSPASSLPAFRKRKTR
jgi:hypothetical protein